MISVYSTRDFMHGNEITKHRNDPGPTPLTIEIAKYIQEHGEVPMIELDERFPNARQVINTGVTGHFPQVYEYKASDRSLILGWNDEI